MTGGDSCAWRSVLGSPKKVMKISREMYNADRNEATRMRIHARACSVWLAAATI
jgi:hypothetical protein